MSQTKLPWYIVDEIIKRGISLDRDDFCILNKKIYRLHWAEKITIDDTELLDDYGNELQLPWWTKEARNLNIYASSQKHLDLVGLFPPKNKIYIEGYDRI